MPTYYALQLAALNLTLIVFKNGEGHYVTRGLLTNNPFEIKADMLIEVSNEAIRDLQNQSMYGFLPQFRFTAVELTTGVSKVLDVEVSYAAIHKDGPVGDWVGLEDGVSALEYYVGTAYTTAETADDSRAAEYWPETLLDCPTFYERLQLGDAVQLLGDDGNLAIGLVVASQRFGQLVLIEAIHHWKNTMQNYEIRTERTKRAVSVPGYAPTREGFVVDDKIAYATVSAKSAMRYGVAVQPAPGGKYALAQLEMELRDDKYLPRANGNFEKEDGVWTPANCARLADNFVSNLHNAMQQLMNTVGEYTLVVDTKTVRVTSGSQLLVITDTIGALTPGGEPLVDGNIGGF